MSIGKRIKKLRLENGLSQADLGKIVGVTDKAVSKPRADVIPKAPRTVMKAAAICPATPAHTASTIYIFSGRTSFIIRAIILILLFLFTFNSFTSSSFPKLTGN